MPSLFNGTAANLAKMMAFHAANGFNPGGSGDAIYAPAGDLGAEVWTSL